MIELLTIAGAIVLASCLAGSMAMWVFGRLLPLTYTRRELSEEEARKLRESREAELVVLEGRLEVDVVDGTLDLRPGVTLP